MGSKRVSKPPRLSVAKERNLAKLLLAIHDMGLTVALVDRMKVDCSDRDLQLDAIAVVACY